MGRKSNAQKTFELMIFFALIAIVFTVWLVNKISNTINNNKHGFLYVVCILGFCAIVFAIYKILKNVKDNKKEKEENNLILQQFQLKSNELIKDVKSWCDNGLSEIKQTDINLPSEKIYFQHPFKWQNVGGKKEYEGNLYITDSKVRYIDTASHQLKFDKIMRFLQEQTHFTLFPDNDKSIIFHPLKCEYEYEQMLVVAKFYAILQIAQGKTLKDFAETFCKILGLTQLKINNETLYDATITNKP